MNEKKAKAPIEDPLADYQPRTELGRALMEARRQLAEQGVPFLSDEELEREIARWRWDAEYDDEADVH